MIETACNVVTGFLGSGKTTLLRHVLEHGLDGQRVAVVMNEIGEIGLDGRVIEGLASVEKLIEFNSGCVCCTIDGLDFSIGVRSIVDEVSPDLVIIETTGIADPAAIEDRLRSASLLPDAVITVVDAANFLALDRELPVLAQQVAGADFIVQTKTDLVDAATARALELRLRELNGRAALCEARDGVPDNALLFGTSVRRWRDGAAGASVDEDAHGHAHGIEAFIHRTDAALDEAGLRAVLDGLPETIYRAKGCFTLASGEARRFNWVRGRVDFQPIPPGMRVPGQAVFIGVSAVLAQDPIVAALRGCELPEE